MVVLKTLLVAVAVALVCLTSLWLLNRHRATSVPVPSPARTVAVAGQ